MDTQQDRERQPASLLTSPAGEEGWKKSREEPRADFPGPRLGKWGGEQRGLSGSPSGQQQGATLASSLRTRYKAVGWGAVATEAGSCFCGHRGRELLLQPPATAATQPWSR